MYGLFAYDGEEGFGGDDAAHRVPNQDGVDGGINGGRGRVVGDFEVYDFVLEPVVMLADYRVRVCDYGGPATHHSLNLETHSVKSPRVSYFGYVMVRT